MFDEDSGGCIGGLIGIVIVLAIAAFVIYCIVIAAAALAAVAGIAGLAWGGGTALFNYGKSLKENLIDSNLHA